MSRHTHQQNQKTPKNLFLIVSLSVNGSYTLSVLGAKALEPPIISLTPNSPAKSVSSASRVSRAEPASPRPRSTPTEASNSSSLLTSLWFLSCLPHSTHICQNDFSARNILCTCGIHTEVHKSYGASDGFSPSGPTKSAPRGWGTRSSPDAPHHAPFPALP